ncbi:MAG: hypothetical protein FJ272_19050 [Planctomycetes bacterium]|nr:hypothetical protein [Planctomycetota bacterium]
MLVLMSETPALRLALMGLLILVTGCGTAPVDLQYRPAGAGQPLGAPIQSQVYTAPTVDRTGGPDSFGGDVNQQMNLKGPLRARVITPYAKALQDSLQTELGRLGIPLAGRRENADAILEATLTKTLTYVKEVGMVHVPVYGAFEFKLSLKDSRDKLLWEGEIRGWGQGTLSAPGFLRVGAGPNDAMNAALADAMGQIGPLLKSEDVPGVLAGLRENRR